MKTQEKVQKLINDFKELQRENDLLRKTNQDLTMKLNTITDFVSKKRGNQNEQDNTKILQQTKKSNQTTRHSSERIS